MKTKITFIVLLAAAGFVLLNYGNPGSSTVQASQIMENPDEYVNNSVNVTGTLKAGEEACTQIKCSEENPNCNTCKAGIFLESGGDKILLMGDNTECTGNSVNLSCDPYEQGDKYVVTGTPYTVEGATFLTVKDYKKVTG